MSQTTIYRDQIKKPHYLIVFKKSNTIKIQIKEIYYMYSILNIILKLITSVGKKLSILQKYKQYLVKKGVITSIHFETQKQRLKIINIVKR